MLNRVTSPAKEIEKCAGHPSNWKYMVRLTFNVKSSIKIGKKFVKKCKKTLPVNVPSRTNNFHSDNATPHVYTPAALVLDI